MVETPEHQFLSNCFMSIVERFSRSRLYSYRESDRRKFDFSCVLAEGWDRLVDGQTLWRHRKGIDKDLRTLIVGSNAHLAVYIAPDTYEYRRAVDEIVQDYRLGGNRRAADKLRVLFIRPDFDADSDSQRLEVKSLLQAQIVEDVLFNIVFGRLTANGVRIALHSLSVPDTGLAVLHSIATEGFHNYRSLSERTGSSFATLKPHVLRLQMAGLIMQPRAGVQFYHINSAGRTFLRIAAKLNAAAARNNWIDNETCEILRLLDMRPESATLQRILTATELPLPRENDLFEWLLIKAVLGGSGIDWAKTDYLVHERESDSSLWLTL